MAFEHDLHAIANCTADLAKWFQRVLDVRG